MAIYKSFDINTSTTAKPWGTREEQAIKDIIDTLVGDTIDAVKNIGGHLHGKLYNSSSVAMIDTDSAAFVSVGTTIAMGANPINYDGTAAVGLLFNSSNEALLQNPVHINNSYNAFYSGNSEPVIYSSVDTGVAYPFLDAGHLVLQGRQTAGRDIVFVTGATPAERVRINSTGDSLFAGTITIQGLDGEGLILNRSGGGGYISYQDGAGAGQWLTFHSNTNNILYNYSASGVDGYYRIGSFTNSNQVSIETSTGNMAVGTSVPLSRFTVQDASPEISVVSSDSAGVSEINIYSQQGGNTYPAMGLLYDDTTNLADLRFNANGIRFVENASGALTTAAVINGSGFLGLNNSSPTARFEMSQSNDYAREILSCFSTTTTDDGVLQFQKSSSATIGTLAVTASGDSLGRLQAMGVSTLGVARVTSQIAFEQDAAASTTRVPGRMIFKTTDATNEVVERMRLDSDGTFGIANSTPSTSAHAEYGNLVVGNTSLATSGITCQSSTSGVCSIIFNDVDAATSGVIQYHNQVDRMDFRTANTQAIRIDSSQNVGIGSGATTPGNQLDIITGATTNSAVHIGEAVDEGGYLTSTLDNQFIVSSGAEQVSNNWTARSTTANLLNLYNGEIQFYGDTSLTDGNTFSPTLRMKLDDTGYLGIGPSSSPIPSAMLDIDSDTIRLRTARTITNATDAGNAGDICWNNGYIFVCVATNTWLRAAITTW